MSETFKMKGEAYYCPNCKGLIVIYRSENREGACIGNCPICSEDVDNPFLDEEEGCYLKLTDEACILLEQLSKLRLKLKKESKK